MHLIDQLTSGYREPIAGLLGIVRAKAKIDAKGIIKESVLIPPVVVLRNLNFGRTGLLGFDRCGQYDVQWNSSAKPRIQELHALIYLGMFLEVIDKTIFDLQRADPHYGQTDQNQCGT